MLYILSLTTLIIARVLGEVDVEIDDSVYVLTAENFNEFVAEKPRVLVEFYAPWCGHCKALEPEYKKAAAAIEADTAIETYLAKVDATAEKALATKYGVSGFPTIKYFTNGDLENPDDYGGGRTEATIVSWIRARSLPPISVLRSVDEVEEFKARAKVVLIGFLAEDSEAAQALEALAEANREAVLVGQVTSDLVEIADVKFGNVYMFRTFGEPVIQLPSDEITLESLTTFFNAERFPLIDAIGPENYKDYMDRGLPLVWISINGDDDEMKDATIDALLPHAEAFKGRLSFTWVDAVKYAQHVQNLGIASTPGILIVGDQKFLFGGDINNVDEVETFFGSYGVGTLEPYLKSEEIPETNDDDIFVLVGKQFAEVIGSDKDVFVEYYAPWCGHCKRLAPEYEEVAKAFSSVADLVIAKIDATENDTPEDIRGFPTLIFYPKGSTVPDGIKFTGDRKAAAIINWIKETATVDLDDAKEEL